MSKILIFTKKALIFQSLFFCALASAQSLYFESPKDGEPLEEVQEFVVGVRDGVPRRMEFYLNGRLKLARKKAPFRFEIRWNAAARNHVMVKAWFPEGEPVVLEKTFVEIQTDFQEEAQVFQCFPFLDKPPQKWTLKHNDAVIQPQTFEPATRFPLSLVIALDISGSMKFDLSELSAPLRDFLQFTDEKGFQVNLVLFDSRPRSLAVADVPASLEDLYNGEPKSVIWDALATGTEFFKATPRRVILLVSDGNDDGSQHDPNSAAVYLKKKGASLIWMNPSAFQNRQLGGLVTLSGGFRLEGKRAANWEQLKQRLENQHHLLAPEAGYPIQLKLSSGSVWYPRWQQ